MSKKDKVSAVFSELCDALPQEREDDLQYVARRIVEICEKGVREART